jgi:hypothetical protein
MITVQNLSIAFGSQTLFEDVDVKLTPGNWGSSARTEPESRRR